LAKDHGRVFTKVGKLASLAERITPPYGKQPETTAKLLEFLSENLMQSMFLDWDL
jgi:hypothetical protein